MKKLNILIKNLSYKKMRKQNNANHTLNIKERKTDNS